MYESALALDSGFAGARAALAEVSYVYNDATAGDAQIRRALALADRLPPRERMILEANAARGGNEWQRAASLHRAYLIRYPDDYDVYALLGYDLMRSRAMPEAMVAYDSLQAHRRLRSNDFINIAQIKSAQGQFRDARVAHVAALRLDPETLTRAVQNEQFGRVLLAMGFADSARQAHSVMLARNPADQARGHRSLAYVDLYEGRYASAIAQLRQAIDINQALPNAALSEVRDRALLANVLIDLGETDAASEQLSLAARLCLTHTIQPQALLWAGKPLARLGDTTLARRLLDSARVRTRDTDSEALASTIALEAEVQLAVGQTASGLTAARRAVVLLSELPYVRETLAVALERAGRLAEARATYVTLDDGLAQSLEVEGQQAARLAPLSIARLDANLGRGTEARQALGRFMERWSSADANLPFVTKLRARVSAAAP
jgi:tetratricopeptide (TPR) repeat protein